MWLWGESRQRTSIAVRHEEIEGKEAQSLALKVHMIGSLAFYAGGPDQCRFTASGYRMEVQPMREEKG